MEDQDQKLWEAVRASHQQLNRARADFLNKAKSRQPILRNALQGNPLDISAALDFLDCFRGDVLEFVDELVEHVCSHSWAEIPLRILSREARLHPDIQPAIRNGVRTKLADPYVNSFDYYQLAWLLERTGDPEMLAELVESAKTYSTKVSDDPDIEDFIKNHSKDKQ